MHAEGVGVPGSRSFNARHAVITLPLGVLQAPMDARGAVQFHPPLADHADAARQLAMGQVVKVTLRFRERFWEHDRLPLATTSMDPRQVSFIYGQCRGAADVVDRLPGDCAPAHRLGWRPAGDSLGQPAGACHCRSCA